MISRLESYPCLLGTITDSWNDRRGSLMFSSILVGMSFAIIELSEDQDLYDEISFLTKILEYHEDN